MVPLNPLAVCGKGREGGKDGRKHTEGEGDWHGVGGVAIVVGGREMGVK